MVKILNLFLILLIICNNRTIGQKNYPENYFRSPVDISVNLSGTFGELRNNHFHSGIDIKTEGIEGKNIYAVADGYVSRVKVSPNGFGKALYMTHPNGYVSVYAHLKQFNNAIDEYVKNEQYKRESFAINIYPDKNKLIVKKSDIIGLSGNSGSSAGPHLHYELRDEATQKPINPLLFGIKVNDNTRPKIRLLKIYPVDNYSRINNSNQPKKITVKGYGLNHYLNTKNRISISGKVFFGIETYDLFNDAMNKNGVYSIELFLDSTLLYSHILNTFSFDETRYINSLIDYREYSKNKRRLQKTYIASNNKLSIYKKVLNNGIINFQKDSIYTITYIIKDIKGNTSKLSFQINSIKPSKSEIPMKDTLRNDQHIFSYKNDNIFKTENIILKVPANALYDSLLFEYKVSDPVKNSFSKVYNIHNKYTPLHTWCNLSIEPDSIPGFLTNKAIIVNIDNKYELISVGGEWKDGYVTTKIRNFGKYVIMIDTIAPEIKALNIYNNKNISKQKTIRIKIKDELSGIESYRGTISNKWILMEYDAKNDLLVYNIDDKMSKGKNSFKLVVKDKKNNISQYKVDLVF
ncbi:MAG: M23 family metallopeptidase [Bacteroidales bacterium]|nr:M23 family metallopeptidase [Bacteroidales bacterium]